ncbi:unnamed protein product [Prorocentrum cordatum]|uniref:Uncharacterized protein n=1 Tax=Prorocentrum cordatum TaxID=2364126 RepID=A0ABN9R1F6_9DINO|nr:unnamed protein product [Polarella glacialis]
MVEHSQKFQQCTSLMASDWAPRWRILPLSRRQPSSYLRPPDVSTGALGDVQSMLYNAFQKHAAFVDGDAGNDHAALQRWSKAVEEATICFSGLYGVERWRASIATELANFAAREKASSSFAVFVSACELNPSEQITWEEKWVGDISGLRAAAAGHVNLGWVGDRRPEVIRDGVFQ